MAVLAINIGGTTTRMAVVVAGKIRGEQLQFPTQPHDSVMSLDSIEQAANRLVKASPLPIDAVGTCIAGNVKDGVVVGSGNLHGWVGVNVDEQIQARLPLPTTTLNDCQAEGLGEFTGEPIIFIGWGTGVGVSIVEVINGVVISRATEFGHMTIDMASSLICGCLGRGHLEAVIGGTNLPARFGVPSAAKLSEGQWIEVLFSLAVGCMNLAVGFIGFPMVLGGGISYKQLSPHGANRLPALQELVNRQASTVSPPKLLLAKHGEDSGIIGAAYAAQRLVA